MKPDHCQSAIEIRPTSQQKPRINDPWLNVFFSPFKRYKILQLVQMVPFVESGRIIPRTNQIVINETSTRCHRELAKAFDGLAYPKTRIDATPGAMRGGLRP